MPVLYHRAPVGHSAKVLIVLAEKAISFESRLIDVPVTEPDVVTSASQAGCVPVLVDDDGTTLAESSVICEYIEETRPGTALMPSDAVGRWQARVWFKFVNEDLSSAVAMLAWAAWIFPKLDAERRRVLSERVNDIRAAERQAYWREALAGFTPQRIELARGKIRQTIELLERRLTAAEHLAGPEYSLADIDAWPFVEPLPRLLPDVMNETNAPRLSAWSRRIGMRRAVAAATAGAQDSDWTLGPEPIRWG